MNLLEHQAKELFAKYGLRMQKSAVLTDAEGATRLAEAAGLSFPLVLKAQVPVGGRGKAGGIRITDGPQSLRDTVDAMFRSEIKGFAVKKLLMEEKAHIKEEWYLSILLDRDVKSPRIVFSTCGGVDIEETAANNPAAIVSLPINPMRGITDYAIQYIASKSGIDEGGRDARVPSDNVTTAPTSAPASVSAPAPSGYAGDPPAPVLAPAPNYLKSLKDVINRLYKMFMEYSCMLVEINPLCVDGRDGGLIALDGKVEIDDSALYRLPDIAAFRDELDTHPFVREARAHGFVYIPMENTGRVAAMSNGSGMLMSMVDLLSQSGAAPACGLDLGGGAQKERISQAVRIALSAPSVDTLFVSIFGGITRCDEVAAGLKEALSYINRINETGKTAIVRMEGTNRDKGIEILSETPGVVLVNSLIEGVEAVAGGHVS